MSLTDTFVRQVKYTGKSAGDKHADGRRHVFTGKAERKVLALAGSLRKGVALVRFAELKLAENEQGALRLSAVFHTLGKGRFRPRPCKNAESGPGSRTVHADVCCAAL